MAQAWDHRRSPDLPDYARFLQHLQDGLALGLGRSRIQKSSHGPLDLTQLVGIEAPMRAGSAATKDSIATGSTGLDRASAHWNSRLHASELSAARETAAT